MAQLSHDSHRIKFKTDLRLALASGHNATYFFFLVPLRYIAAHARRIHHTTQPQYCICHNTTQPQLCNLLITCLVIYGTNANLCFTQLLVMYCAYRSILQWDLEKKVFCLSLRQIQGIKFLCDAGRAKVGPFQPYPPGENPNGLREITHLLVLVSQIGVILAK